MSVTSEKGPAIGIRHLQALLLFMGILVNYVSRLNVSVAVVAMTNANTTNPDFPEYNWSEPQKSYVLSSFYWGYIITQFPGGFLCRRFGAKMVFFIPTFVTGILSAITPYCISWGGWQVFCVIRFVQGIFQGVIFPCVHEHIAKWAPPEERNRLGAFSYSGADCGTVFAMAISGIIAAGSMGWPGISYVSAALCLGWCIAWLIFGANNAPSSRFIGKRERNYIETSLSRAEGFHSKNISIPWRAIWTSAPFYAVLIARCAQGWGNSTMQLQTPSYLHGVLQMDIKSNALYSALPFVAMLGCSYIYLIAADVILAHKWLTLTAVRKTFNTISFWGPTAVLIAIGFLDQQHKSLAIALMTLNAGLNAGSAIGSVLNIIDLSPNHSGILMAVVNGIANFFPLLTPLLVGVIVTEPSDRTQWQIVFALTGIVFFIGNLVYLIWGRMETQPWNAEDFLLPKDTECVTQKSESFEQANNSNNCAVVKEKMNKVKP